MSKKGQGSVKILCSFNKKMVIYTFHHGNTYDEISADYKN